ncbi:MAG: PEP-CTERM sorting domain-containing protein [Phycisphaerales bacterium]|nr:MAG: PEP-CTERM sorting domain-containing protein [Phycisphaerales bacterium]
MRERKGIPTILTVVVCLILVQATGAQPVIDDFSVPDPVVAVVINLLDPDPTLIETADALLAAVGGERDILLDVLGVSGPVSFSGSIGGGTFLFNSGARGVAVTLQYDGVDVDMVGPPASLVNSEGLGGADLTSMGSAFFLDFLSIEGGPAQTTGIEIEVHGGGGSAVFAGQIPDSATPSTFLAPFSGFSNAGVLQSATSIELRINASGAANVDFELDAVGIPEPATVCLLGLGSLVLLWRRHRD